MTAHYWMLHSLSLAEQRLKHLRADEWAYKSELVAEIAMHRFVMDNLKQAKRFQGAALAWYEFMFQHAQLQIMRYQRPAQISETEFFEACAELRLMRDAALLVDRDKTWLRG